MQDVHATYGNRIIPKNMISIYQTQQISFFRVFLICFIVSDFEVLSERDSRLQSKGFDTVLRRQLTRTLSDIIPVKQ